MQRDSAGAIGRQALVHADALYNLARYLTHNEAEAEDLLQETYARAVAAAARFDGRNLKAWLFAILRNTFFDRHRKRKLEERTVTSLPDVEGPLDADLLREPIDADVLRNVLATDLESALRALSPDARTVILLDLEGMTEAESAEILGCAVGTVKSRLSRARMMLRRKLVDYER